MSVERVDIDTIGSPWHEEHLSRYVFITDLIKDKIVLDIACGTGFGTEYVIKNGAKQVFAADVSDDAIDICSKKISKYIDRNDICHKQDGTKMTYPDNSFDVVLTFETIEHIVEYELFVKEIQRVLKPGGKLVLSTPNALITNPNGGKPENPFHVYEFKPEELKKLLSKYFDIESVAGQHLTPAYGVSPFLPSFNRNQLNIRQKFNFTLWRILLRMPLKLRDLMSNLIYAQDFYPKVQDYTFLKDNLEKAHVQYFICKKRI